MLKDKSRKNDYEFLIGTTLFLALSILYFISNSLFFFKISICGKGVGIAILSACICAVFLYVMSEGNLRKVFAAGVICVLLFLLTVWISGQYIDTSFDGNGYRKIMVGLLREGWNPVWEAAETANNRFAIVPKELAYYGSESNWFWMDVYPKSAAIVSAIVYDITNNIESGKYITLLSMICIFCLYSYYLKKYLHLIPSLAVSFCLALNPVSMTQIRTFYVDAFMGNILLIAVIMIMLYFETERKKERYLILVFIDFCMIWLFNIKFNAVFYIACICFTMWIFIIYMDKKRRDFKESRLVFWAFGGGVLLALLAGWSPYITNAYRYQQFMPGIFGDAAKATGSFTKSTAGMNPVEIFWVTIFSKMGDYWDTPNVPLKIPFTVSQEEISNYYIYAPQFGTFGMFFSGIFLISVLLLLFLFIRNRHMLCKTKLALSFLLSIVIFLQCMISPIGYGGLRYVSHFYVIFVYGLIIGFYFCRQKKMKILLYALCAISFLNIVPYISIYERGMFEKRDSDKVLESIDPNAGKLQIALSTEGFYGMLINLRDKGIFPNDYELVSKQEIGEQVSYVCGWQIQYRIKNNH